MKQFIIFIATITLCLQFIKAQEPGTLDESFGDNGLVLIDCGEYSGIYDMKVGDNGKIVVVGECSSAEDGSFLIVQLNHDGSVDEGFGIAGFVSIESDEFLFSEARSVLLQDDGKIIVTVGMEGSRSDIERLRTYRFTSTGELDVLFGNNEGFHDYVPEKFRDNIASSDLQEDNKILVMYNSPASGDTSAAIVVQRLNDDGSVDTDFDRVVLWDMSGNSNHYFGTSIFEGNDGRIYVGGYVDDGLNQEPLLIALNNDGSIDQTFGIDGKYVGEFNTSSLMRSIDPTSYGNITLGGSQYNLTTGNWDQFLILIDKILGDYVPDFGTDGYTYFTISDEDVFDIEVQSVDDKIISAGVSYFVGKNNNDWINQFFLTRFLSDGSIDDAFGDGGYVLTDFGFGFNTAFALELQPDGNILLGGFANNGTKNTMAIARYHNDLDVSVDETSIKLEDLVVYPNPAYDNVTVELKSQIDDEYSISIINSLGQVTYRAGDIMSFQSSKLTIDTGELSFGLNTIVIRNDDTTITKKLMVNR